MSVEHYPYFSLERPGIARDHVRRAFWAAWAGRASEAASHLAQAVWPPKSAEAYETYALSPAMKDAATTAYEDLVAKREEQALRTLKRALYPNGIPAHELVVRKPR
jgi:hypothetical protein